MATASRGRCDTWDMGIGASGRSLSSIEVPNDSELPVWVALQPEGECGVKPISGFFTLRERGVMGVCRGLGPAVVAPLYLGRLIGREACQIWTDGSGDFWSWDAVSGGEGE